MGTDVRNNGAFTAAGRSAIRQLNQKVILKKIIDSKGISKAQIAKELSMSKPAVSDNVRQLIALNLVEEREQAPSGEKGGRKPVMLYFNGKRSYIGAVDLSLREPVCAVADLQYELYGTKRVSASKSALPEQRKKLVANALEEILSEKGIASKLDVIVIVQPGIIETEISARYSSRQHHAWTEIGLEDYLRRRFSAEVLLENDVNAAAMAEMTFGCTKPVKNLIYAICGKGIGASIIIDGALYPGPKNAAGEIGAFLMPDGRTLENTIAMDALLRKAGGLFERKKKAPSTFTELVRMAEEGEPLIQQLIYDTGRLLGIALFNTSAVLDIDTIILGGDYVQLGGRFFEGIEDVLKSSSIFRPRVSATNLGFMAGVNGCFVIGKDKIISDCIFN